MADGASQQESLADEDADRRFDEDEDLRSSVASLATLATSSLGLEELLTEVAGFAVRAIPGADGAGLALIESTQHRHGRHHGPLRP